MQWNIEPSLWEGDMDESFSISQKGIEFTVGQKVIKAVGENVRDFHIKATGIVEMLAAIFILNRKRPITILEKKGGTTCTGSHRFIHSFSDSKGLFHQNSELLNYSDDNTLKGALEYYRLALSGIDQLAIAGNLYMAMEEMWHHPRFGNLKKLSGELKPIDNSLSHNKLKELKRVLNEGRHAFINGKPTKPILPDEMLRLQQDIRGLILVYVEWLKANK